MVIGNIFLLPVLCTEFLYRDNLRKVFSHGRRLGYAACSALDLWSLATIGTQEGLKNQRSLFPQGGKDRSAMPLATEETQERYQFLCSYTRRLN